MRKRISKVTLVVFIGGILFGIIFWGGFHTVVEQTNSLAFCTTCHEMGYVYEEYKESIHYKNAAGVRAICSDCHVPHEWSDKIVRKVQDSKELVAYAMGTISTVEKFQARRGHLAVREWKRMKSNNSQECRNCHDFDYMDFSEQGRRSVAQHSTALAAGEKTCIDCHKGIAHRLPDMQGVEGWQ